MDVLLSIKPRFAAAILRGEKRYEFRKSRFARRSGRVLLYATSPVRRIVGAFTVRGIVEDRPRALWTRCHDGAGIGRDELLRYFGERETGVAIEVGDVEAFNPPVDPARLMPDFVPPRSFRYFDAAIVENKGDGGRGSRRTSNDIPTTPEK